MIASWNLISESGKSVPVPDVNYHSTLAIVSSVALLLYMWFCMAAHGPGALTHMYIHTCIHAHAHMHASTHTSSSFSVLLVL